MLSEQEKKGCDTNKCRLTMRILCVGCLGAVGGRVTMSSRAGGREESVSQELSNSNRTQRIHIALEPDFGTSELKGHSN